MRVAKIIHELEAKILQGEEFLNNEVSFAFSSDLMSDVLTLNADNLLLITGLNNLQTIRTAEMAEIKYILFVRNKKPTNEMLDLAKKEKIVLMISEKSMYRVSGLLFKAGLDPIY
jgi:hypothetical protein